MVNNNDKISTIFSLLLHVLLLLALINLHNTHILAPARSSGIEVGLIPDTDLLPQTPQIPVTQTVSIPNNNPQADIKLAAKPTVTPSSVAPQPLPSVKPATIPIKKVKLLKPVSSKKPVSKTTDKQITDLINALNSNVTSTTKQSKINAINGTITGSSDSTNNMVAGYADAVITLLRPLINLPDDINSNNVAIFEVTLLPNLQVYKLTLIQSSGNPSYDANISDAITNKIAAFPPLPPGAKFIDYRELRLTFRPT